MATATSARQKLQLSRETLTQQELMGEDVDIAQLVLYLKGAGIANVREALVEPCTVDRTIEGASTITIAVNDQDRKLLRSRKLVRGVDIKIDGLWFRLVAINKAGKTLTLTFEDREVAILRTYDKPIKQSQATSRTSTTRAQFILRLLREVREFSVPYVIPDLTKTQPLDTSTNEPTRADDVMTGYSRSKGIPKKNDLTVKGSKMTEEQRVNANMILTVGDAQRTPRPIMVVSIMTAIQESTLRNLQGPQPGSFNYLSNDTRENPVGVFQQRAYINGRRSSWAASRDVMKDAASFFDHADQYTGSNLQLYEIAEAVQHSGNARGYAQWRTEAERIVLEFGSADKVAADLNSQWVAEATGGDYEFYRGIPPTTATARQKYGSKWGKETSWACIQRLAQEVAWRAFFVSGTFYYLSEDVLFKSKPFATIDEDTDGVTGIDGDFDEGKKNGELRVSVRMGRWAAPPGSIVNVRNMGPWDGRWLVNTVSRGLFSRDGTVTLKKPLPKLPEPSAGNVASQTGQLTFTGAPVPVSDVNRYRVGTALIQPIPKGKSTGAPSSMHDTLGLSGYPAVDFFAAPGTDVLAVESGTVERYSGHNPALGAVEGAGGPLGWSIYLKGDSGATYYYTHLDKRVAAVGAKVGAGDVIATVANYDLFGRSSHVHLGVHPGNLGRPTWEDVRNAPQAVTG